MKKSLLILLSLVLVLQICIAVLPQREVQAATGTTYYVSSSTGNDSNAGTSQSKPWKTLAKVSKTTFKRGDKILLKSGDTWKEPVTLTVENGVGTQVFGAYGTGNKPVISAGKDEQYAVGIFSTGDKKNDGWQIIGLEIGDAQNGIMMKDTRPVTKGDGDVLSNGLVVEDCYIRDCTRGLPEGTTGGIVAGLITSSKESYIDNVKIKNVTFERCEAATLCGEIRYFELRDCTALYSEFYGYEFDDSKYGLIKNSDVFHSGSKKRKWGTVGIEFDMYSEHIVVDDCEIAYTKALEDSADGCAIDFEGRTYDITVANCYFHDNAGRAFLMMGTPSSETKIYNNYCVNNGTDPDSMMANGMENEPALFLWFDGAANNDGEIAGNVIVRAFPGQSVNLITGQHTDNYPAGMNAHDNTIVEHDQPSAAPARREVNNVSVSGDRKTWNFADGAQGWWAGDGVDNFKVEGGVLSGGITKHTAEINAPANTGLKITKYPYVKVVMKNESSANVMGLSYRTTLSDDFISTSYIEVPIVPFDTEYREYIFDMTQCRGYSGTLAEMYITPGNGAEAGGFKIKSITLSANKETTYKDTAKVDKGSLKSTVASWDFTKGDNGFTAAGFKTGSNNTLTLKADTEAYLLSPDHLHIDLSKANAISIKMKNASASESASISFVTEHDGYYDLVKTKTFKVNKSESGVTEYLIDLSDNKSFTGTLKEFRINPTRADSGSIQLVSIAVGAK